MTEQTDDFNDAELEALSLIGIARKRLPEGEFFGVAAVQNLACIYAAYKDVMSEDDKATLIAIGGTLRSYADAEMKAGIQAMVALSKARGR